MKKRGKLINWIFYAFILGFIFIGMLGVRKVEAADSTKSTTMTNEEVDQFIDDWIETNIKDSMTDYEKAYKIYEYIGSYSYNYRISNYYNFIRYGQGDCFAFSYAYQRFCNEAGLTCYTRWANMDKGAGGNHRNNVIYINGTYYIVDCNARAVGGERFDKQDNPFLYTIENGKATYVQYFGIGGKVEVPSVIEGCPVTEIRKSAFCCDNTISVVEIPSSVQKLPEPFATSTDKEEYTIKEFQIDKENPNYKSINGDIYSKDGKKLIFFAPNKADFIVEDGTEVISDYAGYNAGRGTELTMSTTNISTGKTTTDQAMDSIKLPNSLKKIGRNAFWYVLGDLTIPEGVEEIGNNIAISITGGLILPKSLKKIGTISTKIVKFQNKDVEIGSKSGRVDVVFALKGGKIEQFCKENNIEFVGEEDTELQKDWFELSGGYVNLSDKAPLWLQRNMYEVEWIDVYSKKVVAKKFVTGSIIISHTVGVKNAREATCTASGYGGTEYCMDCGTELKYGKSIPALGHQWEESEIQKATCTESGEKKHTCSRCNYSYIETISATGHKHIEKINVKKATCTEKGYSGDLVCTDCGKIFRKGNELDILDHTYGEWKTVTEVTCITSGEKVRKCLVCGKEESQTVSALGHDYVTLRSTVATCSSRQIDHQQCSRCHSEKDELNLSKPFAKHVWEEGTGRVKCINCGKQHYHYWEENLSLYKTPTCTTEGRKTYYCIQSYLNPDRKTCMCDSIKTEVIPKSEHTWEDGKCTVCGATHEHQWDEGTVTKKATCTEEGEKIFTCSLCDEAKTEAIPKTGHTWISEKISSNTSHCKCTICGATKNHSKEKILFVDEPTCTSAGVIHCQCEDCGQRIKGKDKDHPALGHNWSNEEGKCTRCEKLHNHKWDAGSLVKSATCIEDGEKVFTCLTCDYTKTEVIKATGHQTILEGRKDADCANEGYTGDEVCTICKQTIKKGAKITQTNDHEWNKGKIIKEATCTSKGENTYTCEVCGVTKTEEIPFVQHQTALKGKKEADCATEGYTGDEVCSVCGQTIKQGTKTDKTNNHKWDVGKVTTEATCTSEGKNIYTCEICGITKTEEIPIMQHKFTRANKKDATCTSKGYTGDVVCKTCGTVLEKGHETNLIQHIWDKGKVTTVATYWRIGVETFTCTVCNNHKTIVLPKITMPKTGTKYIVGSSIYVVTKVGAEVSFIKTNTKAKSIKVPNTIKVSGITYKVTSIGANAFKNCKKLSSVFIGANVIKINNGAFNNVSALKTITIKTIKLTKKTASKKAFNKVNKKMVIKVPKKVKKTYINIFKGYIVK